MYRVMTTARISLLVSLVLCSACPGGGGGSDPDGRPADAGVDGAPGPAVLHVVEGLTAWDFHDVAVDQQSVALALTVANTGATASGTLAVTVTGADAAAFRLDATPDCDDGIVLAPAATCAVRVRFAPTALGARAATLTIDAGGGAPVTVDLTGTGVATAIAIAPAPVALGAVHAGVADATAIATVSNTGADTAAISAVTVTGAGFTLASTTCAGTLAPATSCTATVRFAPTAIGAATGDLVVVSDRGQASAPLAGTGTGAVTVTKVAVTGGAGTVTSAPAGIACGATCSALFGATVVLTAEADATSVFTGWSGACMGVGPCVIDPTVADQAVTATFTGQTVLTIAATGTGTGAVYVGVSEMSDFLGSNGAAKEAQAAGPVTEERYMRNELSHCASRGSTGIDCPRSRLPDADGFIPQLCAIVHDELVGSLDTLRTRLRRARLVGRTRPASAPAGGSIGIDGVRVGRCGGTTA